MWKRIGRGNYIRYPVTQRQIDSILDNELKDIQFPIKPVYNPRIKDNGRIIAERNALGRIVGIKKIEIGKQDKPDKKFLIDTILHEQLEAEILINQDFDPFYEQLGKASDDDRHSWILQKITEYFKLKGF